MQHRLAQGIQVRFPNFSPVSHGFSASGTGPRPASTWCTTSPLDDCLKEAEVRVTNMQSQNDATVRMRTRIVTCVLISAALVTFVIAAMVVWVVAPLLTANAAVADSPE